MIVDLRLTRLQPFSISSRNKIFKMILDITIIVSERGWRISRKQRKETMQSELDKIYEEEFEEKLKGIAKNLKSMGLPTEQIAKATGLSSGEIQAI